MNYHDKGQAIALTKETNQIKRRNPARALTILERAKKLDPDNKFVYGIMTQCLMRLNKSDKAEKNHPQSS